MNSSNQPPNNFSRDDSNSFSIDFNRLAIPPKVRIGEEEKDFKSIPISEQNIIIDLLRLEQEISTLEFELRIRKAAKEKLEQVLLMQREKANSSSLNISPATGISSSITGSN